MAHSQTLQHAGWPLVSAMFSCVLLHPDLYLTRSLPTNYHLNPQLVFAEVAIGAVVLTVNVILLGGDIVFFQALCLLGYCLFPIDIAAIVCMTVANKVGVNCGVCARL